MLVELKKNWFGPDGTLYRKANNPVTVSDAFKSELPKGAVIVEEAVKAVLPEVSEEVISDKFENMTVSQLKSYIAEAGGKFEKSDKLADLKVIARGIPEATEEVVEASEEAVEEVKTDAAKQEELNNLLAPSGE